MPKTTAIIPAGGSGQRMGLPLPKQFHELAGCPILIHTLKAFEAAASIDEIIVVAPADHCDQVRAMVARFGLTRVGQVVAGGATRQDSVRAGVNHVAVDTDFVVVHDGARPFVTPELIDGCLAAARESGAALAAVPVRDTLKRVGEEGLVAGTVDRSVLWQAQTPQVVRLDLLRRAYGAVDEDGFVGTDEASLLEHIGCPVRVVEGSERNLKITRPEDLHIAEALLMHTNEEPGRCDFRIGHGYDAHRLVEGRSLVLGGITVPHILGLLGHSDADVLTHALCDAVLGAVGEGDLGHHFPDSDAQYKGIGSLKLLGRVMELAREKGFRLGNADVTVVAQRPKLAPHFPAMRERLAAVCGVAPAVVNLKGTTTEKMGFAGREEGISAHAVVLMVAIT